MLHSALHYGSADIKFRTNKLNGTHLYTEKFWRFDWILRFWPILNAYCVIWKIFIQLKNVKIMQLYKLNPLDLTNIFPAPFRLLAVHINSFHFIWTKFYGFRLSVSNFWLLFFLKTEIFNQRIQLNPPHVQGHMLILYFIFLLYSSKEKQPKNLWWRWW